VNRCAIGALGKTSLQQARQLCRACGAFGNQHPERHGERRQIFAVVVSRALRQRD